MAGIEVFEQHQTLRIDIDFRELVEMDAILLLTIGKGLGIYDELLDTYRAARRGRDEDGA